jgi:hypothetical protein
VSLRVIWPKPQSLAIARLRLRWPAEGTQRKAEVVASVGMGRIDGQNLVVRCLGLQQPSGLMVNDTPLKQINDRRT